MNTQDKLSLIDSLITAKKELAAAKSRELTLRKLLINELFEHQGEGVSNLQVSNVKVKATFGMTRSIDHETLAEIEGDLTEAERDCLVTKTSLSVSKYKELDDSERATLDECITTKPSLPSVAIKVEDEL